MKPHGTNVMYDLYKMGGTSTFIKFLIEQGHLDGDCLTVTGKTLYQNVKDAPCVSNYQDVICYPNAFKEESHIRILKGNMAPKGCISKVSSVKDTLTKKAIVFDSQEDMLSSLQSGNITLEHFVIIRYQGESTGCPEMLTPTSALIGYFGKNVPPLATDGRFSGGSHGILICHLPDAYKDDSITAIIENNDEITLDLNKNIIQLEVSSKLIQHRKNHLVERKLHLQGYLHKYRKLAGGIENGYSTYS